MTVVMSCISNRVELICSEVTAVLYGYFLIFLSIVIMVSDGDSLRGCRILMLKSRRSFLGPQSDVSVLQLLQGRTTYLTLTYRLQRKDTGQINVTLRRMAETLWARPRRGENKVRYHFLVPFHIRWSSVYVLFYHTSLLSESQHSVQTFLFINSLF